jgi:UDPglucose 6-dehydrogenase
LVPGVGYGGSCFPKDIRALVHMAGQHGTDAEILKAVDSVNQRQKTILFAKVQQHYAGKLTGRTLAIWGLSFKPRTDDIREAPALEMIDKLLAQGVKLQVHDPEAMDHVRAKYGGKLTYAELPYGALEGADGLIIMTEWKEYLHPDFDQMRSLMKTPVIFDGRNLYSPTVMKPAGFSYYSIGRAKA